MDTHKEIMDKFSTSKDYSVKEMQDIIAAVNHSIIVAITNQRGEIIFVNDHFCNISQYSEEELLGQDHRILNSGFHPKVFFKEMWRTIGQGHMWTGEICNRAKDGSLYWVQTTIMPFLNDKGKPYKYIAIRTDITAQKDIKKITHIAYHDDLTGLPNRRNLVKRLSKEIDNAAEKGTSFAMLLIDVNRFKNINDGLGHVVGDMFLVEMANRLRALDDTEGSFYRHNSDEFVYILNDVDAKEAFADRIMLAFKESFLIDDFEFYASVSIGISTYSNESRTTENLMRNADTALHTAKAQRISNYQVYQPKMEDGHEKWLMIETKLHDAIENNLLTLNYQPKIDIRTNEIIGMEALLRWTDAELGFVPPDYFIPFAEESGLINQIGMWVMRNAGKQIHEWNKKYNLNLRMAINVSPMHISAPGFVDELRTVVKEEKLDPNELELEITEMTMLDYTEELITTIGRIRRTGIMMSIDDFGTGYASLSYLKNFPVDILKIDRSFIQDIIPETSGVAMVSAIISLAHALGLEVVAEGVEEKSELDVLLAHGCEYVQGYYFSKPLIAADFEKLLVEGSDLLAPIAKN